jgi:hypothetical protein
MITIMCILLSFCVCLDIVFYRHHKLPPQMERGAYGYLFVLAFIILRANFL